MTKKLLTLDGLKKVFYVLMAAVFCWFLFMQFCGANEQQNTLQAESVEYSYPVFWEKGDGSSEEIAIPGEYDVPAGQTMVLISMLPEDYDESSIAIRSSLQDVRIYIDGELRQEYSTQSTRMAGKNSASRYVFCNTSYKDAGKQLRIELTTYTSNYSGVVNQIYSGSETDIWQHIYNQFGFSTYIAVFILLAGLTSVIFSVALRFAYHSTFEMEYFGWCMIMGSVWILGESKIRQILVPNASALASLCFVMIMLCPLPLLFYADSIQKGIHRRLYLFIGMVALADFTICSLLYYTGIKDYIETLPIGQCILVVVLLLVFIHLCLYVRSSKLKSDYILLVGLFLIILCVSIESASVYFMTTISGIFVGVGMMVLLLVNLTRTIENIQAMEAARRREELEKEQKQTEAMTLQMMRMLSVTVEAKDEYTRGHSQRVAEYAALIAEELGWSEEEIQTLKNCAYLHDIGKIGIPDHLWNKPGRLTEDEYTLIKQHTVIGANILKGVTMVPHLSEVTRSHHERYDGTGYPDGLKGEEIPLYARIVSVANCFDAMHSRRIYREALPVETIKEKISQNAGTQFDPEIAQIFLRLMEEGKLELAVAKADTNTHHDFPVPSYELTMNRFIADVVNAFKGQEDKKSYDMLTGLPSRNLGEILIAHAMKKSEGCLAFIDMDNLKKINDLYGHKAGDRALKTLGALLTQFNANAAACRLGGDEFLLFLPNDSREQIKQIMSELFRQFYDLTENDAEIHFASLSAGLCMSTVQDTFADCYTKADKALYFVKQNGKNQFSFFDEIIKASTNGTASVNNLQQIADALQKSGSYTGALNLDYREFTKQFEYIRQLSLRNHWKCYLVMVTMKPSSDIMLSIDEIEQALSAMGDAIQNTIRKVDICTRYSEMQYLIILSQPEEEKISVIMERIFTQYRLKMNISEFLPVYEYICMDEKRERGKFRQ